MVQTSSRQKYNENFLKKIQLLGYKEVPNKIFLNIFKIQAFISDRISKENLADYLKFVKFYSSEANSQSSGLISNSEPLDLEERAVNFLHRMNYSITKAKFYLIFPLFLNFNEYRPNHRIELSEKEMQEKIEQYIDNIKEGKVNQYEKWKDELDKTIKNRVQLNKLQILLEQGKTNKYDIPEYIKEIFEKANKFSKELKKVINDKAPLEDLIQLQQESQNYNIITNEMILFEEGLNRSYNWLERMKILKDCKNNEKIQMKLLNSCILEYKSLPLQEDDYKKFKNIYDQANSLLEKLPSLGRISKTRMNINVSEKISIEKARELAKSIEEISVKCDEVIKKY